MKSRKSILSIMVTIVVILILLALFTTNIPINNSSKSTTGHLPYPDLNLSAEERAAELLSQMTTDEKIGQMTQIERGYLNSESDIATYFLGSVLSGGGSCPSPNTPLTWAQMYNRYQQYAVENTRLGIPILYGIDAVHGHNNVWGAVIFPHNIGMGSTWNPDLVEECAHVTAVEVGATGIDWTFSPVVDVARNDRWGRTYESFGEDPYLAKWMGASAVRGYQGTNLTAADTIIACAKHYMGSGGTTNGVDQGNCVAPMRIIREVHLEPFIGAVQAGTQTIMASFCSVNGQKIHGREDLLTDVLKTEQGFSNFIVSDWAAVDQVDPGNYKNALKKSINAGIDMVMVPGYPWALTCATFQQTLRQLITEGGIPMSRINDAVYRILVVKFRLGLFENPYVDEDLSSIVGSQAHREVARQAVQESMVLLKNDGILPLSKNVSTVYVAGPNADDIGNQCGGWTITWQGSSGDITPGTTILEAIRDTVSPGTTVIFNENADNITSPYDVGIVVVGETPYAEGYGDTSSLDLPSSQMNIIQRVVDSGTPTVVIMVAGRPRTGIESALSGLDAFMMAWLPGTEGQGVADVLFGDVDATGRLSHSWPKTTAQEPINYDRRPGESYDPLFEFGYGLSYTNFTYSNLEVTPTEAVPKDNVTISVDVTNTGSRSGREVVQVYVNDVESTLSTPVKKLYRAEKIPTLGAGENTTVSFSIPVQELGYYTDTEDKVVEPGTFNVMVGGLNASFEVVLKPDIAITNVTPHKTVVGQEYPVYINATAENQGTSNETFNVTAYANTTVIDTATNVTLTIGNSTTITFTWNTTGFAKGNYTIKAIADTVPGESFTSDNTFVDGIVQVVMPGDITADGKVNVYDLRELAKAYGAKPGQQHWNPNVDLNDDGKINIKDLRIIAKNYGKTA